jgi:hypothetical protein
MARFLAEAEVRELSTVELELVFGGNRSLDSDRDGIPDYDDWEPDIPRGPRVRLDKIFRF